MVVELASTLVNTLANCGADTVKILLQAPEVAMHLLSTLPQVAAHATSVVSSGLKVAQITMSFSDNERKALADTLWDNVTEMAEMLSEDAAGACERLFNAAIFFFSLQSIDDEVAASVHMFAFWLSLIDKVEAELLKFAPCDSAGGVILNQNIRFFRG